MRRFVSVLLFLTGVFIMVYVSNWLMFIRGIMDVAGMFQGKTDVVPLDVSLLVVRFIVSPFVWGTGAILFLWGGMVFLPEEKSETKEYKQFNIGTNKVEKI